MTQRRTHTHLNMASIAKVQTLHGWSTVGGWGGKDGRTRIRPRLVACTKQSSETDVCGSATSSCGNPLGDRMRFVFVRAGGPPHPCSMLAMTPHEEWVTASCLAVQHCIQREIPNGGRMPLFGNECPCPCSMSDVTAARMFRFGNKAQIKWLPVVDRLPLPLLLPVLCRYMHLRHAL
jgi:hypothetical protein